jgi:hypothetical protein
MNNSLLLWATSAIYVVSALGLLFSLNVNIDIGSSLFLLGGGCIDSSAAVDGQFYLGFRVGLVLTSLLVLAVSVQLLRHQSLKYLMAGIAGCGAFIVINHYWVQFHPFEGFKFSAATDMFDAVTTRCYLYEGPQYGVLLAISLVCVWGWVMLRRKG